MLCYSDLFSQIVMMWAKQYAINVLFGVCFVEWMFQVEGLQCALCQNVTDVQQCNMTTQCTSDQSCYMSFHETTTQSHIYNLGCLENEKCGGSGSSGVLIGRRQTGDCEECCASDLCNSALCSHSKPSACVDDERQDCANLQSLFHICQDVQHAKLICPKFCRLCDIVDGAWTSWSNWSSCDVTCGNGSQVRARQCSNPMPAHGGLDCTGNNVENVVCIKEDCPVHGGWSLWSPWGECSSTCDFGIQRRDRSCSNPYPSRFGDHCYGESRDDRICIMPACADGGWSTWSEWTSCSVTCGSGFRKRNRACNNPRPSPMGLYCEGSPEDIGSCNNGSCHALAIGFSVDHPASIVNQKLTFTHVIYNYRGQFSESTGIFTCSVPGSYLFSVHLVKKRANSRVDQVACDLYLNNNQLSLVHIDPTDDATDNGQTEGSATVLTSLKAGDIVYLTSCSDPATTMEWWTVFTGVLLYAESPS